MSIEIKVPELPESIADAVIASWYKSVGDYIGQDEVLVDLETDKVVLEVPALKSGIVTEIRFKQGDTVTAGELLAVIDEQAEQVDDAAQTVDGQPVVESVVEEHDATADNNRAEDQHEEVKNNSSVTAADGKDVAMSPSVRKMMAEHSITPDEVVGSGKHGRILKQDVETVIRQKHQAENAAASPSISDNESAATSRKTLSQNNNSGQNVELTPAENERLERRVPMTRLRSRIAERLVQAQHNAAILTTFNEVNMQPVMAIRQRYKEAFQQKFGVKLGFMSFFVQASIEALKRFPEINASIDGNDVVYHGYYDIGVAVSGPNGLVVPVLRDADLMSLDGIEQGIMDFGQRARNNALTIEDITGGTFTISNGGVFGSMLSTPILNPPQSAILGMHNIVQRAMVVDDQIVVLPMMYLALSYDHRLIDGKSAVQFLVTIKQLLEDPSRMMLGL